MACKYIYENITYSSKEEFINKIVSPQFLKGQSLTKPFDRSEDWQSIYQREKKDLFEARQNGYITGEQYKTELAEIERKANLPIVDNGNAFLHLLSRDNNWVTFFIKSIIQDTAKQTITEVQESDVEAKVRELEKEGLLEIDCKGKFKAEKGIRGKFTKGSQWEIVKDLKGYPSHAQGGIDVKLGKDGFSFKGNGGDIKAAYGLVLPKIK